MILTNGERINTGPNAGEIRQYRLILQEDGDMWVQALNGNYKGERLTFTAETLKEYNESEYT
jgi:hypothetical protein